MSIASGFVFGNTNLFMTAGIRYFAFGSRISKAQFLLLSEVLVLGLAYMAATQLIKDNANLKDPKKADSPSTPFMSEGVFELTLLVKKHHIFRKTFTLPSLAINLLPPFAIKSRGKKLHNLNFAQST